MCLYAVYWRAASLQGVKAAEQGRGWKWMAIQFPGDRLSSEPLAVTLQAAGKMQDLGLKRGRGTGSGPQRHYKTFKVHHIF